MKRNLLLLLILFLPAVFTSGRNTFTEGLFQYIVHGYHGNMEVKDSSVTITSIDRSKLAAPFYDKELVIPATVVHNGSLYIVEEIGKYAFAGCNDFERVVISEGIEMIEGYTFNGCNNLQSVSIPSTVEHINGNPFPNCLRLEYVSLPESMEQIERLAFRNSPCEETVKSKWGAIFAEYLPR